MNIELSAATLAVLQDGVVSWVVSHSIPIAAIVVVAIVAQLLLQLILERVIRNAVSSRHFKTAAAEKKREDTLIRIAHGTLRTLIWIMATLMLLSEAGINIGPLLAAAGVAGIAVGFGGQYLIRDIVAGVFIILENQYRVGDVVRLDTLSGVVEDVTIRKVTLRDLDGTVHHIPHGTVATVSNLSKDFARVNLNVGVGYKSDMEKVINVINAVGQDMAEDEAWKDRIIKAPAFERVEDFADSAIMVKILGDTQPLEQWRVTGELRKRLKIAFDREGIEIPFPQRVVHTA